jgi:hypothetical protein
MEKFRVAYIDESDEDIRKFQFFADNYFEIVPFKPIPNIEELVVEILQSGVDALVIDFDLKEEDASIKYNGADLVNAYTERREGFPVFILTSYDEQAIEKGDDVNIVYEKKEMYEKNEKFLEKIFQQIKKYHKRIEEAEEELLRLVQLRKESKATLDDEKEILRLDHFIESSLDKQSSVPQEFKELSNAQRLSEILSKVDELLNKVEKKKDK